MLLLLLQNKLVQAVFISTLSVLGGIYIGYDYTKNFYETKISRDKATAEENIITQQAQEQKSAAQFVTKIREEQSKSSQYQKDARMVMGDLHEPGDCKLTYGFVRLFNASATGSQTAQSSTDSLASPVDIATLLAAIIENHGKYREAARQIEAFHE